MRMLVSASRISVVQFLPAQSLTGIEPHAFGLEPSHHFVEHSRPALRLGFLGGPVPSLLENLQEVISQQ